MKDCFILVALFISFVNPLRLVRLKPISAVGEGIISHGDNEYHNIIVNPTFVVAAIASIH